MRRQVHWGHPPCGGRQPVRRTVGGNPAPAGGALARPTGLVCATSWLPCLSRCASAQPKGPSTKVRVCKRQGSREAAHTCWGWGGEPPMAGRGKGQSPLPLPQGCKPCAAGGPRSGECNSRHRRLQTGPAHNTVHDTKCANRYT